MGAAPYFWDSPCDLFQFYNLSKTGTKVSQGLEQSVP